MRFTLKAFFAGVILFGFTSFSTHQTSGFITYGNTENKSLAKEDTVTIAEESFSTSQSTQMVEPQQIPAQPSVTGLNTIGGFIIYGNTKKKAPVKENTVTTAEEKTSIPQTTETVEPQQPSTQPSTPNKSAAEENTLKEEEGSTSQTTQAVEPQQPSAQPSTSNKSAGEENAPGTEGSTSQTTETVEPQQPSTQPSLPNKSAAEENTLKEEEGSTSQTTQAVEPPQPPAQPPVPNQPAVTGLNTVGGIDFEVQEGVGIVTIKTSAPVKYEELPKEERKLSLELEGVLLPDQFQVSRDVSDFDNPISFISSFRDPVKEKNVMIIVELKKDASKDTPIEVKQEGNLITIRAGKPRKAGELTKEVQPAKEAPIYAFDFRTTTSGAKKIYRGQLVSFDFKDADVRDVLRILADVSGFNFVVSSDVKGTVTLKLSNVPWDQALDVVLENAGLGALVEGNVIKISPLKTIQARQAQIQQAASSTEQLEPLVTRQVFINYAKAEELRSLVEPLLSKRGQLKIDVRTNSILVTDTAPRVAQIEGLAKSLDTRTPQVLIESRIVQATLDFTRQLGVQFGTNYRASAATGNPTGAFFPSSIQAGGVGVANPPPFGNIGQNFIVDLPAATGPGAGGALGIILGSLTGAFDLDIRLSALERRGDGRILSSPRVLTLDNQAARIEQGVSIPFLSVSAAGTQTQFVDATLRLEVTPHITNDGRVLMTIKVTDNSPDTTITGANGQPAIRRNEAESQVLATDGDTIVIGGIFTRTTTENLSGLPWLSRIPLLGWLFRNTLSVDQRRELLVFITPRIVK